MHEMHCNNLHAAMLDLIIDIRGCIRNMQRTRMLKCGMQHFDWLQTSANWIATVHRLITVVHTGSDFVKYRVIGRIRIVINSTFHDSYGVVNIRKLYFYITLQFPEHRLRIACSPLSTAMFFLNVKYLESKVLEYLTKFANNPLNFGLN